MSHGLQIVLVFFGAVGYAGAGAALAVAKFRSQEDGARDLGMLGVSAMLVGFGAVCTLVAVGWSGVLALGAVLVWASYVLMAESIGMFRLELGRTASPEREPTGEPRAN